MINNRIKISLIVFCLMWFLFPPFILEAEATQITLSNAQSALNSAVSSSITLSSYTVHSDKGGANQSDFKLWLIKSIY